MPGNRRFVAFSVVFAGCVLFMASSPTLASATTYYVNCAAASNGNGTSASPWNNLATVNGTTFAPGDSLLFNRGTTCAGSFVFSSSGTSTSPITIGAYGTGPLPAIDGTGQNRAVKLLNTSYVTVQNLEVKNSRVWGVLVTTNHDAPAVGITLKDLDVHHVAGFGNYYTMSAKWTGLVVFAPGMIVEPDMTKGSGVYTRKSYFDTVVVDNVTAYDTDMWAGIFVWGVQIDQSRQWKKLARDPARQSRNIRIRNSTVHDTNGDGIAIYMSRVGSIENSVVYRSGLEPPPEDIGTPVGLWWWSSSDIAGNANESYDNQSPGVDGGAYDIDYWSTNSTLQYNYGHDNAAFCIGVFGYSGTTTRNIARYNICAGNGTKHTYLHGTATEIMPGQSEIYLCTWGGGRLADTWIYNNTFYVNSTGDPSATGLFDICPGGGDSESNGMFKNNLVVSAIPNVLGDVAAANKRVRDYNLYYYTGGTFTDPRPEPHGLYNQNPLVNGLGYHGVGRPTTQWTLQSGSPAIDKGTNACAGLAGCAVGTRDFFGNPVPNRAFDIGAHEAG
jgi:parallel beta helix pectate lyase-like protein